MLEDLIYDRNETDVEIAHENPASTDFLKGAYNYADLNRVEAWCKYLQEILMDYKFSGGLNIKTDWNLRDYPTRIQIDRIRNNVDTLRNFCYSLEAETIVYNNTMNYEQANVLEKILYDVYEHFQKLNIKLLLPYNFASTLVRTCYVLLNIDNEILTEEKKINMGMNIGIMLVNKEFITLNVKEE